MTSNAPATETPSQDAAASKALVEKGYDAIAPKYLAWSAPRPTTTRIHYLNNLIGRLTPGAKVLELGCGAGVPSTQVLIKHGLQVTGVDISASQIELAHEHVPEATLIHSDMMSVSFEPGTFDAVVAFYSIFHLPMEEQGLMIKKMSDWLKEGGLLLFNLNTKEGNQVRKDWMGVDMFSSGLGVDGNREILKRYGDHLRIEVDDVVIEKVGQMEEKFHWVLAARKGGEDDKEAKTA